MGNNTRFKIDINSYASITFPIAVYLRVPKWWGFKWQHMESFRTQAEAVEFCRGVTDETTGLPVFLP